MANISAGPDGISVPGVGWTNQSTQYNSNLTLESDPAPNPALYNQAARYGFIAWSALNEDAQAAFTIGTTLTNYLTRVYVPSNAVTTKTFCFPLTNVANISAFYMGLYSSTGTQLAATAESHTALQTSGNNVLYTPSWVTSVTVTGGLYYYVTMIVGWATGAPTFAANSVQGNQPALMNANLTAATAKAASNGTAATPPASYTMASNTTIGYNLFVGLM